MTKRLIAVAATLLFSGCLMPAEQLAGFTEPGVRWQRGPFGYSLVLSSDFEGTAKGEWDPETGKLKIDVTVNSKTSDVTLAQGERAFALEELRRIEVQYRIETQRMISSVVQALASALQPVPAPAGP